MCAAGELDRAEVDDGCDDVDDVCQAVGDSLHVGEALVRLIPASPFEGLVPVGFEGGAAEICHDGEDEVEDGDHGDGEPYYDVVDCGEAEGEEVCADGVLEDGHCDQVYDLADEEPVAVWDNVGGLLDARVEDVSAQSVMRCLEP